MEEAQRREPAQSFQDLIVWQKAHEFVLGVYTITQAFPKTEIYGLTSQFRRAAVSVPANNAEGFRKGSRAEKARFLNIAEGSLEECRYYLILARDLNYDVSTALPSLAEEIARLLNAYRRKLMT